MKILKFNISADGTTLNVTPNAENSNISQYEVVKVQVDLDSATLYPNETERCAVILNLPYTGKIVITLFYRCQ